MCKSIIDDKDNFYILFTWKIICSQFYILPTMVRGAHLSTIFFRVCLLDIISYLEGDGRMD